MFITAAGNNAADDDNDTTPFYPCDYTKYGATNIICVAATDSNDNLASFSNFGAATVHLGAPGVGIVSTYLNQGYASLDGTSQATPHVTGAAALLKGCKASLSSGDIKVILLRTVRQDVALIGVTSTGGVVNYANALNDPAVGSCDAPPVGGSPVANPGGPYNVNVKKPVQFNGTASSDSGGRILLYYWNFGDGTYGVGPTPVHQYTTRGSFVVTLTVRDSQGTEATQSTTVNVRPTGQGNLGVTSTGPK